MIEYIIFSDYDTALLAEKVTELLNEGWELQGGVSCSLSESDDYQYTLFAQALIKKSATDKESPPIDHAPKP